MMAETLTALRMAAPSVADHGDEESEPPGRPTPRLIWCVRTVKKITRRLAQPRFVGPIVGLLTRNGYMGNTASPQEELVLTGVVEESYVLVAG